MKRSEMLEKIDLLLWNSKNLDVSYVGPKGFTDLCEELLDTIEKEGMLPPAIDVEIEGNRGFRTYKRNAWDEE